MRRIRPAVIGLSLAIVVFAGACSSNTNAAPGTGSGGGTVKTLSGAGATFPAPLYQKWADEYNKAAGVQVNYQAIGSGGGITDITQKIVDFGASDAPMKDEELSKAPGVIHIPTVFGAVVVTYNVKGVPDHLKLTSDVIAGIFLRDIKTWNDAAIKALNPGVSLPATAITPVHRSDGSGTTSIFTSYLKATNAKWSSKIGAGKEVEWPKGELGGKGNDGVTAGVKGQPGGVGYIELAYAKKNNLPTADVKNKDGNFVAPSLESITAAAASAQVPADLRFSIVNAPGAGSYPISGATWLLVYKDQTDKAKGTALVKFLWWAVHDGEGFAESLLYAKLPPALVTADEAAIKSITSGGQTLYQG